VCRLGCIRGWWQKGARGTTGDVARWSNAAGTAASNTDRKYHCSCCSSLYGADVSRSKFASDEQVVGVRGGMPWSETCTRHCKGRQPQFLLRWCYFVLFVTAAPCLRFFPAAVLERSVECGQDVPNLRVTINCANAAILPGRRISNRAFLKARIARSGSWWERM
jgi:hypothetical protein